MAKGKKNGKSIEITFKLKDHLTNTNIGNAEIQLYSKTDSKFSKKGKSSNNGIVKITIDEEDLKKKLYVKINKTSVYYPYPYPNDKLPTYAVCYKKKVQEVRFLSKKCIIGIVKAYNHQIGSIYSSESEYLSNWQDEILTIDKEQTITLKAFIVSNISEEGIREPNGRYFLNNSDKEEDISCIKWAFKITTNTKGFKIDTQATPLQVISASITLNNETKQDTTKFNTIEQINTNNIYKLMKSGKEVTGHTIDFRLSDIFTENLIKESSLYKYYIVFFAYEFEEDKNIVVEYDSSEDNLPLKQLKIVTNKYSMVFDGYNLELYENGKYIKNFEAKLMLDGKNIDHDSFPFMSLSEQKYIGLDDLYICKLSAFNKVNYVTNQVTDIAHKIMDSVKNNKISDNATTNNMPLDNATSNSIVLDNATTINTTNNNLNNANYSQDNDFLITHYMRTYMNMLSLSEPQYNTEKNSTKKNTDTGSNTKISINYIIDEKILHDKDIILQNLHQTNSSNDDGYTKIKNDMIKLNNSILLSSNNFKSLILMVNFQSDILVKFIYQPKYVIEVTRYKEVYNSNKSIQNMKERYGATYGVFAVYVYYNGEKFLLDSVIDAYNGEQKNNKDKVIDKDNIISTHIETINSFVNNHKNHHSIKTDMYKKNLQNKANYGNLMYGGYTMEPAGPDNITEEVKRRISEGHYKGIYHKYSRKPYKCNTMNLYSDMVRYKRYILVHAGGQNIAFTTGCILVSTESYETGNIYNSKDLNDDKDYNTSTMKILKRLDNLYKALYKKTLGADNDISSCISLVIRNQMNRG